MIVTFWGVRGSVPSPGPNTIYYGGNTTCLTVETHSTFIIIDAGTGIINVGPYVKKKKIKNLYILFTHYHWDHLQGLPFFNPIFDPDIEIEMFGKQNLRDIMSLQMKQPFFPADYKTLPSKIKHSKIDSAFNIDDISVETVENNHPNGCLGMKFIRDNKSFVFMTDNEIFSPTDMITSREEFVRFAEGSDYLIHDAQYTEEDMQEKEGWGHSTFSQAIELGRDAGVENIVLTHHDPMRKDKDIKKILEEQRIKYTDQSINAGREFMSFEL